MNIGVKKTVLDWFETKNYLYILSRQIMIIFTLDNLQMDIEIFIRIRLKKKSSADELSTDTFI